MPFAGDVHAGLGAQPKTLPPKYFYDELGSQLFEVITLLPEYYLTRAESEILDRHAADIVSSAAPARLLELGSGSATKTRRLIDAALGVSPDLSYAAIDISETALAATAKALHAEYPALAIRMYQADYLDGLRDVARAGPDSAGATLALLLGSNIGNFEPPEALAFLQSIRAVLAPNDALLLGTDLRKDRGQLEAAYDDALGVTSCFNRNLLLRINRELSGHFQLTRFRHRAVYNEAAGRVEMHLESLIDQRVRIDGLALDVPFSAGETIHTESSYKFSLPEVERLARTAGFWLRQSWSDGAGRFACNLLSVGAVA